MTNSIRVKLRHSFGRCALLIAFTGLVASQARASITGNGMISSVITLTGGQVLFNLTGDRSSAPGCHTQGTRWAFDGTTAAGQEKLAVLPAAHATGRQISVNGKGTCDVWLDTESVDYIATLD